MLKIKIRDLFPVHVLLMIFCLVSLSVLLNTEYMILSPREQGLMRSLIYSLAGILSIYFILKLLWHFYLSRKAFSSEQSRKNPKDDLTFNNFIEQTAPSGYKQVISNKFGFSFCYPKDWQLVRSREKLLHMQIREPKLEKGSKILRNFNVSYQNIDGVPNTDLLFEAIIAGLIRAIEAKLEFEEPFKTKETFGIRYKLKYNSPKRTDLCCYQVAITNNDKKSLILLTFTVGTRDFPNSKELFDDISNLVRIFKKKTFCKE